MSQWAHRMLGKGVKGKLGFNTYPDQKDTLPLMCSKPNACEGAAVLT